MSKFQSDWFQLQRSPGVLLGKGLAFIKQDPKKRRPVGFCLMCRHHLEPCDGGGVQDGREDSERHQGSGDAVNSCITKPGQHGAAPPRDLCHLW